MGYSLQLFDGMPDELKEAANDAVAAFGESDLDPAVIVGGFEDLGVTRGRAVGETNPFGELGEGFLRRDTLDPGVVDPLDAVAGVEEVVGEIAVVREDDEARGIPVETAHGEVRAVVFGQIVGDRTAALRVGESAHDARRFVKEEHSFGGGLDDPV